MSNMDTVINAVKTYSPKHAVPFENALRDTRSQDIPHLANCVMMICSEYGINSNMPNPFPHDTDEHTDWAGMFEPADVLEFPSGEPVDEDKEAKAAAARKRRNARAREKRANKPTPSAKPTPKPKSTKKAKHTGKAAKKEKSAAK